MPQQGLVAKMTEHSPSDLLSQNEDDIDLNSILRGLNADVDSIDADDFDPVAYINAVCCVHLNVICSFFQMSNRYQPLMI